jgi:hypothetical protein
MKPGGLIRIFIAVMGGPLMGRLDIQIYIIHVEIYSRVWAG